MSDIPVKEDGGSFAQMMSNFTKLTELEAKISSGIQTSKIPPKEVRKFLKTTELDDLIHNDLVQFMCQLFNEMGLGMMQLTETRCFRYQFTAPGCPVCSLFPDIPGKKVCAPTVDALTRFFGENMNITANTIELRCINMGDPACEYQVTLKPLPTYQVLFDEKDDAILRAIAENGFSEAAIMTQANLSKEDMEKRLDIMRHYQLLDHRQALTSAGDVLYKFLVANPLREDEDFSPPWKEMAQIRDVISKSSSFAQAMVEIAEEEKLPWEGDDAEIVDLRDKAKSKGGFAEFLASEMDDEEEEG